MQVTTTHTLTNESNLYLLVANYNVLVSQHVNETEALAALSKVNVIESGYASAQVVAPNETITGTLAQPIYDKSNDSFDILADFFGDQR